ncbi:hypothetical protein Y1Q_0006155 [Alligator mississippiensis]|uniref:Uncharacterized protein n=1 Tax=Alligator mississippiensis TaxID=8496 RepID=A0A151NX38_ALLMI|nr:hypothetical protein Y1Q_0006155 [Alligator mississippiensis]
MLSEEVSELSKARPVPFFRLQIRCCLGSTLHGPTSTSPLQELRGEGVCFLGWHLTQVMKSERKMNLALFFGGCCLHSQKKNCSAHFSCV